MQETMKFSAPPELLVTIDCRSNTLKFYFERMAVTLDQIAEWNLPTRPTKRPGTHAKMFEGDSVELDAIPPKTLKWLIEWCITHQIDQRAYDGLRISEANERE